MASRQYSLRWNNYTKHLSNAFESLRSDRDLTDVTLSCEGKKVPAHKMLLSACSSYFKSLFKENPCQHPIIIFRNVAFDDLMALIEFMYKGEVNVEEDRLSSFLNTAELLEVQGLTNSGKDVDKSKKTDDEEKETDTNEQQPEAASTPFSPMFGNSTEASPQTPSRKRRRMAPAETEEVTLPKIAAMGEEPVIEAIEEVSLKTEAPDFEHIELNPEDSVDGEDLGGTGLVMEGEMENYSMAGPSNDSLAEDKGPELLLTISKVTKETAVPVKLDSGVFACPVCGKSQSDRSKCITHIKSHFCETTCSVCGREFGRPGDLKLHMALHEGRTTCPKCKKVFSRADRLKIHLNKCSGS